MATLAFTIQSDDTVVVVDDASGLPTAGDAPGDDFVLVCESEKMLVRRRAGTTLWNVIRGYGGTTAARHLAGTAVRRLSAPFINVCDYGAVGDDSQDDTAAIIAALLAATAPAYTSEGFALGVTPVYFPAGIYRISDQIYVPPFVDLIGAGMRATVFRCTASGAGVVFGFTDDSPILWTDESTVPGGDRGGRSGGFYIDGNDLAAEPLYIGLTVQRHFDSIEVRGGAGFNNAGITVAAGQNNTFTNVNSEFNAGSNLRLDYGTGGNKFFGCELNQAGRYNLELAQSGSNPIASLYDCPADNHFHACIFERAGVDGDACLYLGAGGDNYFNECNIENWSDVADFPGVKIRLDHASGVGPYYFTNCRLQGSQTDSVGFDIAGALNVRFSGTNQLFLQKVGIKADDNAYITNAGFINVPNVTTDFANQDGGVKTKAEAVIASAGSF